MAKYNGFANRSQWNQSLWINNDEGLYQLAKENVAFCDTKAEAVDRMYLCLQESSSHTPDGYKWSKAGIRAAMVGL